MTDLRRIARLSNAVVRKDGKAFKFDIETDDDEVISFEIAADEIEAFITYIANCATTGFEALGVEAPSPDNVAFPITGIPLRGVSFSFSDDQSRALLSLQLPGFWMSFQLESTQLDEFARRMASIARLLGTTGKAN